MSWEFGPQGHWSRKVEDFGVLSSKVHGLVQVRVAHILQHVRF